MPKCTQLGRGKEEEWCPKTLGLGQGEAATAHSRAFEQLSSKRGLGPSPPRPRHTGVEGAVRIPRTAGDEGEDLVSCPRPRRACLGCRGSPPHSPGKLGRSRREGFSPVGFGGPKPTGAALEDTPLSSTLATRTSILSVPAHTMGLEVKPRPQQGLEQQEVLTAFWPKDPKGPFHTGHNNAYFSILSGGFACWGQ